DSLRKRMMVASDSLHAFSADENHFLLETVRTAHGRAFESHEELVPNGIVISGREPTWNGCFRKNQIGVARRPLQSPIELLDRRLVFLAIRLNRDRQDYLGVACSLLSISLAVSPMFVICSISSGESWTLNFSSKASTRFRC